MRHSLYHVASLVALVSISCNLSIFVTGTASYPVL